jgi:hypothetical protein
MQLPLRCRASSEAFQSERTEISRNLIEKEVAIEFHESPHAAWPGPPLLRDLLVRDLIVNIYFFFYRVLDRDQLHGEVNLASWDWFLIFWVQEAPALFETP